MKVLMTPCVEDFEESKQEGGVRRVIEAYAKYLPKFGVELVPRNSESFDLRAIHAGVTGKECEVAHLHGLYWTADYPMDSWAYQANANIVSALRTAKAVTVPSAWVAEPFQRDMRFTPDVVPHGIDVNEWEHSYEHSGYILWNKNRTHDVCFVDPVKELASRFPAVDFVSTYLPENNPANVKALGLVSHNDMKKVVQKSGVYLSTVKETFGIGVLEAMASAVPILGFRFGGNVDLVKHGINGYLAEPNDYEDLANGLTYCIENRSVLGRNGQHLARQWTWEKACKQVAEIYERVLKPEEPTVSVIIPCYNYGHSLERTIESVRNQTYPVKDIIVVDDGSSDNSSDIAEKTFRMLGCENGIVIKQSNAGVANARNVGIKRATSKYICCLDADDMISPEFLNRCVTALENDPELSIAYTKLMYIEPNGRTGVSGWPDDNNYDYQLARKNQLPTCCVYKKLMWERLGGYRQRYAPLGAGSEDAEFWLRAGAYGFVAKKATDEPLFVYSMGTGLTSKPGYSETDWLSMHPWTQDNLHPFASLATPKKLAHDVRQYDMPSISVVIPIGSMHQKEVVNALDSLDSQLFRSWEAVLVWDMPEYEINQDDYDYITKTFPFTRNYITGGLGAGGARNLGVDHARGKFVLFLDADDSITPDALQKMMYAWNSSGSIVYSDYVGKSFVEPENLKQFGNRILSYNDKTKELIARHYSQEYDYKLAQAQPSKELYYWCLVTCLIPKAYHNAIGGFDEKMESWEDVDYHWRLARAGYSYVRIDEPLVVYRFYTGTRREKAIPDNDDGKMASSLLKYMMKKYERIDIMPCKTCGQSATIHPQITVSPHIGKEDIDMSDGDFLLITYNHANLGMHPVYGPITQTYYGYRGGGDQFLVHKKDVESNPQLFVLPQAANSIVEPVKPIDVPIEIDETEESLEEVPIPDSVKQFVEATAPKPASIVPEVTKPKVTRGRKAKGK